jgi:hypothetical protein
MSRRTASLAALALVLFASAVDGTQACAQVVLEQYDAPRPREADAIMAILRDEFGLNYIVARPGDVAMSLFLPPRPAILDTRLTSAALIDELELAIKPYIRVNYSLALVQLTNALAHADANYGLIVRDPKAKVAMLRAQVALALTYKKQSEKVVDKIKALKATNTPVPPELVATMKELVAKANDGMTTYIRSTRDPVVPSMFGPPGEDLYNAVRKTLDPAKRANLTITVTEPEAQVFVNGVQVNGTLGRKGAMFSVDPVPGPYCIVLRVGGQMLRYDTTTELGQRIAMNIDWSIDTMLNVSDEWVGLTAPRDTESTYVHSLSLRMGGQISIVLVGLRRERDYLVAHGRHYVHTSLRGDLLRSGEVHIASGRGRDEAKLRELVRYLATGKASPNVLPIGTVERTPNTDPNADLSRPWLAYAAGAGAVGAFALGGYSLSKEYGCNQDPNCKYAYPRAGLVGYASIGVGVGLSTLALYWLLKEPKPARRPAISVTPSASGVAVSWMREF